MNKVELVAYYQSKLDDLIKHLEFLKRGDTRIFEQTAERPQRTDITARVIADNEGHVETYKAIIDRIGSS